MDIAALVYEGSTQKNASSIRLYMGIFGSPNSTLTFCKSLGNASSNSFGPQHLKIQPLGILQMMVATLQKQLMACNF
jgi:hypothetical protein